MTRASERIAYHNGELRTRARGAGALPGSRVQVRRRGLRHHADVRAPRVQAARSTWTASTARCATCASIPGLTPAAMVEITEEVLRRNLSLLDPDDDYWVTQRVTRGASTPRRVRSGRETGATVIVECVPLPLRDRAPLFRDGIRVLVPSVRRTPPEALSPRAKTHNYLNMVAGDLEVEARDPEAWAVLLDANGNLAEGLGSNIFLVSRGTSLHAARAVRAGGDQPRHGDGAGARGRPHRGREGSGPVRRLQRRRGIPDVDQPLRLSGAEHQRGRHRRWAGAG